MTGLRAADGGSASINPIMFAFAVGLMLAWRVAGYYGGDRYLLPRLGTPWSPGVLVPPQRAGPAPGRSVGSADAPLRESGEEEALAAVSEHVEVPTAGAASSA